jgi:polar amino acid transport system ATP-binding protein
MFQDFQLFPHMTVLQNLIYAPALKSTAEEKQLFIYKAREILRDLGIEEKASVYPGTLSGGQKQRVALARSLMIDPDVLLCDEPTSGLDMVSIMDVVALLQKVNEQLGVTIVIASHDLVFLTKVADRIALIKSGKIAVDLKPSQCTDPVKDLKEYY